MMICYFKKSHLWYDSVKWFFDFIKEFYHVRYDVMRIYEIKYAIWYDNSMYDMLWSVTYEVWYDICYVMIGTENVALAVGLGTASHLALQESYILLLHMLTLKKRLIELLLQRINDVRRIILNVNESFDYHHYNHSHHHHHHQL